MKRNLIRLFVFLALAGVVSWLVVTKTASDSADATEKQKENSGPGKVLVTVHEVSPTTIVDTLSTVGTLVADESLDIKNETAGKVVDIAFEEGERVERGDLLLRMRSATLRAQLETQKRRKNLLEKQVERQRKVLDKGGVSQEAFDKTKNELEVLKAQIGETRAKIAETSVHAPFSGTVGIRKISPGAILNPGTTVAELNKLDPIEVEFTVPERYASRIERGQEIRFRLHGTDKIHRAEVSLIEPELNESNRTLTVRARIDNPDRILRAGAYAQVRVAIDQLEDVLAVPATALTTTAEETYVWVSEDGTAKKQVVETGMRTEDRVVVTDGLSDGDVVVTTNLQSVKPGAKLEVDTSEDAMDVESTGPDPSRPGMRNKWFSEEPLEDNEAGQTPDSPDGTDGGDEGNENKGSSETDDQGGSP